MYMRYVLFLVFFLFASVESFSQTISVGDSFTGEIARIHQITGMSNTLSSFSVRPLNIAQDTSLENLVVGRNIFPDLKSISASSSLRILPFSWLNEYNLNRPYGYNNGSLYPNKGFQTRISGGVLMNLGILNIQLKPEAVYAQNKDFETFAEAQANNSQSRLLGAYFNTVNGIDAPERFGYGSITKLYPGQSKITINLKGVEAGVSTENMWWGPGIQNSIMMSNSAPGFLHWTINSVNPWKTKIGSFEWQIIGGNLKQSGYLPTDTGKLIYAKGMYMPKPKVTRYISAFTVNWQPKWIEGLFLGITEYDYLDKDSSYNSRNVIRRLFPVLTGSSQNANTITSSSNGDGQDFAFSVNVRQILPKYNAEIYFEWARNDRTGGLNDFLQEPEHSSAYTVGGRRLFAVGADKFLQIKMELTHLQNPPTYLLRDEPTWYVHLTAPRDGYTNDGRYVGAGIGPGSNSLIGDISFLTGQDSFGITLERLVHNNDLYYSAFSGTNIFNQHWVDLSNTFYANLRVKHYVVSAEITPVYSLNYEYKSGDSYNLHARINLTYYFN